MMRTGGVSNLLFMNENGTMVERTADFSPCLQDPTQDRDVVIKDINGDERPDVITAPTFGEHPRVYINLGDDSQGNWRGLCLCYDTQTDTCHDVSYLSTNAVCYEDATDNCFVNIPALNDELRIPTFPNPPHFCGVAAGDVDDDDCPDLYFTDYECDAPTCAQPPTPRLFDRLLLNTKVGGVCTGFFTDVTNTPSTRLCPNGSPCFYETGFGTGAQIIDMNNDGVNDIVRAEDKKLDIMYNDENNVGHFDVIHHLHDEFLNLNKSYMFAAGDMNQDLGNDLYVVKTNQDAFLINMCVDPQGQSIDCDRGDGTVQFVAPVAVSNSPETMYNGGNAGLIDLNNDTLLDVLVSDLDAKGTQEHFLRILRTHVNPQTQAVDVRDPMGTLDCDWSTRHTYDTGVLDIDGDGNRDLWAANDEGNHVFLWYAPTDCDGDNVTDGCLGDIGACCPPFIGVCSDTFRECCDAQGGLFLANARCGDPDFKCPSQTQNASIPPTP